MLVIVCCNLNKLRNARTKRLYERMQRTRRLWLIESQLTSFMCMKEIWRAMCNSTPKLTTNHSIQAQTVHAYAQILRVDNRNKRCFSVNQRYAVLISHFVRFDCMVRFLSLYYYYYLMCSPHSNAHTHSHIRIIFHFVFNESLKIH